MKVWVSRHVGDPKPVPGPLPSKADLAEGVFWPYPPEWTVRFGLDDVGWVLDIEIAMDNEGECYVTGIAVRSGVQTSASGTPQDPWLEGAGYEPVVPREIQRLPLTRYTRAALAVVNDPLTGKGRLEMQRMLVPPVSVPRGRPSDQPGPAFYANLLAAARRFEAQGISPVPEIAKRKKVSQNLVYQWLYRARRLDEKSQAEGERSVDPGEDPR